MAAIQNTSENTWVFAGIALELCREQTEKRWAERFAPEHIPFTRAKFSMVVTLIEEIICLFGLNTHDYYMDLFTL
jgi:hypothetical protein